MSNKYSIKHGFARLGKVKQIYSLWCRIKDRCNNPNKQHYERYGGRGIKVCERWQNSFENFLEDMGERPSEKHSIDRIDVNGDYCKENCRWATKKEQANNTSTNKFLLIDGQLKTIAQWSEIYGVKQCIISKRIIRGWNPNIAVKMPPQTKRPTKQEFNNRCI